MFEHTILPGSWWLRRLTGSLSPEYVAQAIVRAIEGGKANTVLRLPFFTHSARLLGPTSALVPGPMLRLSHWVSVCKSADGSYLAGTGQCQSMDLIPMQANALPQSAKQNSRCSNISLNMHYQQHLLYSLKRASTSALAGILSIAPAFSTVRAQACRHVGTSSSTLASSPLSMSIATK